VPGEIIKRGGSPSFPAIILMYSIKPKLLLPSSFVRFQSELNCSLEFLGVTSYASPVASASRKSKNPVTKPDTVILPSDSIPMESVPMLLPLTARISICVVSPPNSIGICTEVHDHDGTVYCELLWNELI
jgi:hypothetical protein